MTWSRIAIVFGGYYDVVVVTSIRISGKKNKKQKGL